MLSMVPTQAIGFHDIEKRMEVQNIQSQAHKAKLQEIDQRIKKLQETTLSENAAKLIEAKRHYMEVTQRVINVSDIMEGGGNQGLLFILMSFDTIVPQTYPSFTTKRTLHHPWRRTHAYAIRIHSRPTTTIRTVPWHA